MNNLVASVRYGLKNLLNNEENFDYLTQVEVFHYVKYLQTKLENFLINRESSISYGL